MFLAPVLLSMIADVVHGYKGAHVHFHEWKGQWANNSSGTNNKSLNSSVSKTIQNNNINNNNNYSNGHLTSIVDSAIMKANNNNNNNSHNNDSQPRSAAQVIMDIWKRYDPEVNYSNSSNYESNSVYDDEEDDELMIDSKEDPHRIDNTLINTMTSTKSNHNDSKRASSMLVSRECLVYGSLSEQRRKASDAVLNSMDGTTMLGKVYAIFR